MNATRLTAPERRTFRTQLNALVARLSADVPELAEAALRPPAQDDPAVRETEEEVARAVLPSEEHILAEAQAALARLKDGTFGVCEMCGHAIQKARLGAIPYARTCVRCAHAAESA